MGIEWADEALAEALTAYWGRDWADTIKEGHAAARMDAMRAALDAAVKAQFKEPLWWQTANAANYRQGRAEALEEAAQIALKVGIENIWAREIAAAIRARSAPEKEKSGG